jgi:hypothetical protein
MPKRRRTRAKHRAQRITAERQQNHQARTSPRAHLGPAPPSDSDDEPPPF